MPGVEDENDFDRNKVLELMERADKLVTCIEQLLQKN